MASTASLRTTVIPMSKERQRLGPLIAEWRKTSDALIDVPLFKDGVVDRQTHEALRHEESEARKRLSDFLDSPSVPPEPG